jgi:1-deoxy-D-xylulose-5-phosphate reductoisomerase
MLDAQTASTGRGTDGAPVRERRVIVLGSAGSIGTQTLDVIEHLNRLHERGEHPTRTRVVGLATGANAQVLAEQQRRFGVPRVAITRPGDAAAGLRGAIVGPDSAEALVREVEADLVVAAIVGVAGLPATLAAVELGRDVALANKETLVAAGELVIPAARRSGARLLPVDSEHCALWQCVQGRHEAGAACGHHGHDGAACPPCAGLSSVRRVFLTASGGPFRTWTRERIRAATPDEALKHPTWAMGPKVTIDSATLTNKALEVIEAHWLFGLPAESIEVLVHPQSLVHAIVEFDDGAALAQLGASDMRCPIQYALTWPYRPTGASRRLDFAALRSLDFEPPDLERFPALGMAWKVIRAGGTAGAVFNAANEAAVNLFLERDHAKAISFGAIAERTVAAFEALGSHPVRTLDDVLRADAQARDLVAGMRR